LGIQKGDRTAKREVTAMMQERLEAVNAENSEKIVGWRAELPELPPLDDSLDLEAPSLEAGIDRAQEQASRYQQQLLDFEKFVQCLLLGRVLCPPVETNGLENAPLLQVFGGARSICKKL
jgi:hypothetical protein